MWCLRQFECIFFLDRAASWCLLPHTEMERSWLLMSTVLNRAPSVFQQDASVTQATSRAGERIGEYNPFSASEVVGFTPVMMLHVNMMCIYIFKITFLSLLSFLFVSQGNYSDTTIPISAATSQPAVLQTSVEQSPQVSQTFTKQKTGN